MNSSLRKIIAGIFVMASTVCYAAVPQDSKFKAIVYDQNTKNFVAVGSTQTAAILAVSKDGRIWTPHNILGLGGNWESVNEISINNDGDIYLVDSVGDIFIAKNALHNNNWNFRKIASNMENQGIVGEPLFVKYSDSSEQENAGLAMSIYYLVRPNKDSDLKQIIRVDYTSLDGNTYSKTSHIMKTGYDIEQIGIVGFDASKPDTIIDRDKFVVELAYKDNRNNMFSAFNNGPFGQMGFISRGAYSTDAHYDMGMSHFGRTSITPAGAPILETVTVSGEPPYLCDIADPSSNSRTANCTALPIPSAFSSINGDMQLGITVPRALPGIKSPYSNDNSTPAVVAMNDMSDGKGVAVIYGTIIEHVFIYNGASSLLEVAARTCVAGGMEILTSA